MNAAGVINLTVPHAQQKSGFIRGDSSGLPAHTCLPPRFSHDSRGRTTSSMIVILPALVARRADAHSKFSSPCLKRTQCITHSTAARRNQHQVPVKGGGPPDAAECPPVVGSSDGSDERSDSRGPSPTLWEKAPPPSGCPLAVLSSAHDLIEDVFLRILSRSTPLYKRSTHARLARRGHSTIARVENRPLRLILGYGCAAPSSNRR